MIKEIALLGALASLYITEPSRANDNVSRTILNSTEYSINFSNEVTLEAHSEETLNASAAYWTDTYISVVADSKPTDIYYWLSEIDNEQEVLCTFYEVPVANTYYFDVPDMSSNSITGIQFFQKKSLVDEVFYITQPNLENQNFGIGNILPEGSSALLDLQGNSSVSITKLTYQKTRMDKGILGYAFFKINDLTIIANNSVTGVTPNSPSECSQIMMYQGTYTNKLTFTSGYYPRMWNKQGYNENILFLSKDYQPYATFSSAGNTGISLVPITTGVTLVALSFEALNSLLGYVVFPGLTLGMLLLVPVFFGVMFTIIKLVKKG